MFTKTQDFILLSLKVDHYDTQPFAHIQLHWWNHAISHVVNINCIGFGEWVPMWDYLLSFPIDPILCNQCNCKWRDDFCISAAKKKKKKKKRAPQMTSLWCKNSHRYLFLISDSSNPTAIGHLQYHSWNSLMTLLLSRVLLSICEPRGESKKPAKSAMGFLRFSFHFKAKLGTGDTDHEPMLKGILCSLSSYYQVITWSLIMLMSNLHTLLVVSHLNSTLLNWLRLNCSFWILIASPSPPRYWSWAHSQRYVV